MSTVKKSSILVSAKENDMNRKEKATMRDGIEKMAKRFLTEEEIKKLKEVKEKTIKDHKIILK